MAEEIFQGGVCGGNWWNSSINLFGPSPCSPTAVDDTVSFGWLNHPDLMTDIRTVRSISDDSAGSASDGSSSVVLQDAQNPQHPMDDGNMPMTSTLQMMGICLSSSTTTDNWNLGLLDDSGRSVENYSHMLQESACLNSGTDYRQQTGFGCPQIHQDRSSKTLYEDSCIDSFTQMDPIFAQEQLPSPDSLIPSSTAESAATCQGLSAGCFPLNPASCGYNSTLLQTLFDADSQALQSLSDNRAANCPSSPNYQMNSAETLASLSKTYPEVKPSLPEQHPANHLQLTGNSMALATGNVMTTFLPSILPQVRPRSLNSAKPNLCNFGAKFQHQTEGPCDLASEAKKVSNEPALKRPRIEAPSPLPTFKVRKEKMGDRITALQQLVSPFGKTDTASVLHEAIEYVKFLHDQVKVLSAPYLKDGSPPLQHQQAADHKIKKQERQIQDLNSRGLCLVPISSTIPVAAEASNDFWPPTFGGSFR